MNLLITIYLAELLAIAIIVTESITTYEELKQLKNEQRETSRTL